MAIQDTLEEVRDAVPSAETAAFLDLRAGMVLKSVSGVDQPQERLDELSGAADLVLGGAEGDAAEAIAMSATATLVFCRAASDPGEALCLICAPDTNVAEALDRARAASAEM